MQGEKRFAPKLFYDLSLKDFIGPDHFLVRLEELISLEWVRERTKHYYSHTGKPSVDPVALVKMLLIGYLYDIRSERRLVQEIKLNLAYRWYVGYDLDEEVPNHSVFSKARVRFGLGLFLQIFEEILKECVQAGLLRGEGLLVDSTIVRADAAMDSIVELALPAEEYWRMLDEDEMATSTGGRKLKEGETLKVGTHFRGEVDVAKMGKRRKARNAAYLRKRSRTDPDATLFWRRGIGPSLAYKVHVAADTSGVITAVAVSASAEHDTSRLPELIERHAKNLGTPEFLAADSTYATNEALTYLHAKGIQVAVPPMGARKESQRFPREAFRYDEEGDLFICPAGKALPKKYRNRVRKLIIYLADAADCAACEMRTRCMGKSAAKSRMITRVDNPICEEAERFRQTERARELMLLRHTVLEGLFGEAKTFHGLSRAKMRGLERVEIQALLTASALNLKRLVRNGAPMLRRALAALRVLRCNTGCEPVLP